MIWAALGRHAYGSGSNRVFGVKTRSGLCEQNADHLNRLRVEAYLSEWSAVVYSKEDHEWSAVVYSKEDHERCEGQIGGVGSSKKDRKWLKRPLSWIRSP
ncbi:hypothetical protein O6P43_015147 [Quillaja saponaria]|uniref:Uncharacterized protein n=1 Tax=Quillaja saponaria TaxID=32244 RepID=A0AAD7LY52_QUISA|nr:hypothetical protein O6P43_015147 [Quillaja saponaria]